MNLFRKIMLYYPVAKIRSWIRATRDTFDSKIIMYADSIGYAKWRRYPLGHLRASKTDYDKRFSQANNTSNSSVDNLEKELGCKIPADFLEEVAYHVQISFKKSFPDFTHGRVLYSVLSDYIENKKNVSKGGSLYMKPEPLRGFLVCVWQKP